MRRLWGILASTWLTIVLAAAICMVSAWGSVITVRNPEFYRALDTKILLPWLLGEGMRYTEYTLWIYMLIALMAIFAINTIVCTTDRVASIISRRLPWQSFFPHIVHIGFLVAMVGHLLSSTTGFRSYGTVIFEGDLTPVAEVPGLSVRLDGIQTESSPEGELTSLKTTVSLVREGAVVRSGDIEINGPLIHRGVAFYHLDQGSTFTGLQLSINGERVDAHMGEPFKAGGVGYSIAGVYPDFVLSPDGRGYSRTPNYVNPYVEIVSTTGGRAYLGISRPGTRALFEDGTGVVLEDFLSTKYAVLAVHRDPGIWPIIIGSSLLVVGMLLLLFMRGERGELMRGSAQAAGQAEQR